MTIPTSSVQPISPAGAPAPALIPLPPLPSFTPRPLADFAAGYNSFRSLLFPGSAAEQFWNLINTPEAYIAMRVLAAQTGEPQITAVAKCAWPALQPLAPGKARTHLASCMGAMVGFIMQSHGGRKAGARTVPAVEVAADEWAKVFKTAEFFRF